MSFDPKKTPEIQAEYQKALEDFDNLKSPTINMGAFRNFIMNKIPFYSKALQTVDIITVEEKEYHGRPLPSFAWTDGFRVFIAPKHYAAYEQAVTKAGLPFFSTPEIGYSFLILHELGHIILDSFGRLQHRDPKMWNIATDYQINQFVTKIMQEHGLLSGMALSKFVAVVNGLFVLDEARYGKMTAEQTYTDQYKLNTDPSDYDGAGLANDMMPSQDDQLTDNEKMVRDIVHQEMKDYAAKNAGKLAGKGSAFREFEFLNEPPKVSLREVLKKITDRTPIEDFTFTTRASRYDHMLPDPTMKLPVLADATPGLVRKVFVVLDSSGSMTNEQLNDAINITKDVLMNHTKNPIHLIIHTSDVVYSDALKDFKKFPGGFSGGTAFMPVVDEIARLRKEEHVTPSVVIWMTDLYGEKSAGEWSPRDMPFHKILRWVVSGSKEVPKIGKAFYIDTIE